MDSLTPPPVIPPATPPPPPQETEVTNGAGVRPERPKADDAQEEKKSFWKRLSEYSSISFTERTVFTQNLYVMVKSGIPLSRSLETLSQQSKNKRFQAIILRMKRRIERGESFSKALEEHPKVFSEIYVSMVSAGEASGRLEQSLQMLATQMKKDRELIAKVRSAMTYPIIVVIAMVGIGVAMMVFVIPKITDIYVESGAKLPLPTQILISISHFIVNNGLLVGIGAIVLMVVLVQFFRSKRGKRVMDAILLFLPISKTLIQKINLARFARTLSSLLRTDIPIVEAFHIIRRTLGNSYYREAMSMASEALKKGVAVKEVLLSRPKLFPPMVTQMVAIGEESGTLDELADEIANFYEHDVEETMNSFSSIIEPILLLFLGAGVAGMAIAILLPMYSLTEQI